MIMAGACAVQIGTALHKGYDIFKEITDGLSSYLDRKSMSLDDLCGLARRRS
jgi:dihydroorotate dehydrogenase (NAD+) catalytic subunit